MIWFYLLLTANVEVSTSKPNIDLPSLGQRAGTITMTVTGNDFIEASLQTPVYVRVRLDKGARLAETLVDVETALWRSEPIFLAMSLLTDDDSILRAPSRTVSIARWNKGESEFWLKVQDTSSYWLETSGGILTPPDINRRVQWTIGRSVEADRAHNEPLFAQGRANLKSNERAQVATPTFLLLDTGHTILEPYPSVYSLQNIDTIGYDFQTRGVLTEEHATGIRTGDAVTANFSGDDTVGVAIKGTPRNFMWSHVSLEPILKVRNLTQEQQPAVVGGDRETVRVFVAAPGMNTFSLKGDWIGTSLVVEEDNDVTVQLAFRNSSGHVFSLNEAQLGTGESYLVQALERGETTFHLSNPNSLKVLVGIDTMGVDGNAYQIAGLELGPGESAAVPVNIDLSELVRANVNCIYPIYSAVVQHHDAGDGVGWVRSVSSLPMAQADEGF